MSTLIINLQSDQFNEVKTGERPLVFRERNDVWRAELEGKQYDKVIFKNGFPHAGDTKNQIECEYRGYDVREAVIWGDQPQEVFAIYTSRYRGPIQTGMALDLFPEL